MSTIKVIQKRIYDILSNQQAIFFCFVGLTLIIISAFHFGEIMVEWSQDKYASVFNSFSDNISGRSMQTMLTQYVPIDAVYTWVNGSDPSLLAELYKTRLKLSRKKNSSHYIHPQQCTYSNCVQSHLLAVYPAISRKINLYNLNQIDDLKNVTKYIHMDDSEKGNFTLLVFCNYESASKALDSGYFVLFNTNHSLQNTFLTTDWMSDSGSLLKNTFIMTGLPSEFSQNDLKARLPGYIQDIFLYHAKNLAVLTVYKESHQSLVSSLNITLHNKTVSFLPAYLVLEPLAEIEDVSSSRFADNEELRYSLRSLIKHIPWIRQVFIVTNGQIPYWLNLDNPRIKIVTHSEIFPNASHLPTFSSPAIECHLHRISGLSKKFLYINDDVFFGKDIWPNDFYTRSKGHKVYLSWPVPDCSEGCPTSWIKDGYCDRTCNNSNCEWDGGDCLGAGVKFSFTQFRHDRWGAAMHAGVGQDYQNLYCNPSCSNNWLSDRYCDQACNVKKCGFDAGDCGTFKYSELHSLQLNVSQTFYELPRGISVFYFNLSKFMDEFGIIESGSLIDLPLVRVAAASTKSKVFTIVLQDNAGEANLSFTLKSESKEFYFVTNVDTTVTALPSSRNSSLDIQTTMVPILIHDTVPLNERFPKIKETLYYQDTQYSNVNSSASNLSSDVLLQEEQLKKFLTLGLLTETGFNVKKSYLIQDYLFKLRLKNLTVPKFFYMEPTLSSSLGYINHSERKLLAYRDIPRSRGFLPWENQMQKSWIESAFSTPRVKSRKLFDTYGDSLRHVNKLYNRAFGYQARKVPSHMAHFVDVEVIQRLQKHFEEAFQTTSSHKIRSPEDMQFAFSFNYFLMNENKTVPIGSIFDEYDTDNSGTWSDREIRTLLTRLYPPPLKFSIVSEFEESIINCSSNSKTVTEAPHSQDNYYDSKLPPVTKQLITRCGKIANMLTRNFGVSKRNLYETVGEEEVVFKMIHSNVTQVLGILDAIRREPKKFICLNDNLGHGSKDSEIIKAVVRDFYESLFPIPSPFELPADLRNRFLHTNELREWQFYRKCVRMATFILLGGITVIIFLLICPYEICSKKLSRKRRNSNARNSDCRRKKLFQV